jgi:hypothetical protein
LFTSRELRQGGRLVLSFQGMGTSVSGVELAPEPEEQPQSFS